LTANLVAGIISSLFAVMLVEMYQLTRKSLTQRPLRKVFGSSGRRAILVPKFPGSGPDNLLDTHDAIGLAHILSVLNRFRIDADVLSSERVPDEIPANLICIGGWSGNSTTAFFMQRYCPGFVTRGDKKEGGSYRTTYYEAGGKTFIDGDDDRWGFIVKLSPAYTGLSGTVLLLWGHDGIGTAAAAFFASQYASKLSKLNQDAFFVSILANKKLGYRSVQLTPIDISTDVFDPSKVSRN
jgi:hypothetical protein